MSLRESVVHVGAHEHPALSAGPVDGEFVLLLHGWPEFADCWSAELSALGEAGYHAVAVTQRGYAPGARPTAVAEYSMQALVADALAFAAAHTSEPFHLVAHDWGGVVAWALAGAHPERLRSLSVLATPHPAALRAAAKSEERQNRQLDYVRFFRRLDGAPEAALLAGNGARLRAAYGEAVPAELVRRNVERLSEPGALAATLNWYRGATDDEFTVAAGPIAVPTLFLWGSEDAKLGRLAAETTGEQVTADYTFVELTGRSHWLPEEAAAEVIPQLLAHLRRH